jgi:membrane associated rhomboid family serine protease
LYGGYRQSAAGAQIPVTLSWVAATIVVFLAGFFGMTSGLEQRLAQLLGLGFLAPWVAPWTLLTWPLVGNGLVSLIFGSLWAVMTCSSLERSWGSKRYLGFLAASILITGLSVTLGALVLGIGPFFLGGLWAALAAPTVAWCVINRRETITLNFLFPVPAPVLMWITMALLWFSVSSTVRHPLLGLFSLAGCGFAYWYVVRGREWLDNLGRGKTGAKNNLRFQDFDRDVRPTAARATTTIPTRKSPMTADFPGRVA